MLKSTVRALQAMLDRQRILALAVQTGPGPYAGLLPFVPVADRSAVLVHASKLARHTQGLAAGAHVGILVHEQDGPEKDPLQIERLMQRDSVTREQAIASLDAQATRAQRLALADDVILNTGQVAALAGQVAALHEKYVTQSTGCGDHPP